MDHRNLQGSEKINRVGLLPPLDELYCLWLSAQTTLDPPTTTDRITSLRVMYLHALTYLGVC